MEREQHWNDLATSELEEKVKRYYEQALEKIRRDTESLYARYAGENGLSMVEARRLIRGKEFRQWRMTLEEYVKAAQSDSAILKELNTLAMRSRITRLESLHAQTLMTVADLCDKLEKFEDGFQYRAYLSNYYGTLYDIHREVGLNTPPVSVDKNQAEKVIRTAWSGANYSRRIWKNGGKLEKAIEQTVLTAIHRGKSTQKLSRDLSRQMNVSYNNAERLVRTELNFVFNKAALDSIQSAGLDHYRFVAALDHRTCPRCGGIDGLVFEVTESMPGENYPPMHPRCRCTVVPTLGETTGKRTSKVDGKRVKVPAEMNYTEWKAVYIDKTKTLADWQGERTVEKNIKRREEIRANFTPAKDLKGATQFAKKTLGIPNASYKGLDIEVANEWNLGLLESFTRFPELKKNFKFVGECHEATGVLKKTVLEHYTNEYRKLYPNEDKASNDYNAKRHTEDFMKNQHIKDVLSIPKNAIALSRSGGSSLLDAINGVTINRDFGERAWYLRQIGESGVKRKFHPQGCENIRSHLDHEIGHQLDKLLDLSGNKEVQAVFENCVTKVNGVEDYTKLTEGLSEYAWRNKNKNRYGEFIAEAWAEYCNNPKPREIARRIGEITENEYNKRFGNAKKA